MKWQFFGPQCIDGVSQVGTSKAHGYCLHIIVPLYRHVHLSHLNKDYLLTYLLTYLSWYWVIGITEYLCSRRHDVITIINAIRSTSTLIYFSRHTRALAISVLHLVGNVTHDWQHLLLHQNLAVVSAIHFHPRSTKNSSVQPSFERATDTISDEENVGRQRSRRSGAMSRFFALLSS